jgi:hypothetical protein
MKMSGQVRPPIVHFVHRRPNLNMLLQVTALVCGTERRRSGSGKTV